MTRRQLVRPFLAVVAAGLATAALAVPARAQGCGSQWRDPVVCRVDLVVTRPGERRGETVQGSTIRLPVHANVELHVVPTDQFDRPFPADHFRFVLDVTKGCNGFFDLERVDDETVRLKTSVRVGECDASFWVPNNTNFDRQLRFRLERSSAEAYSRTQAGYIARALFRAILDREPEPSGLATTAQAIERGEIPGQVHAMLRSPEFEKRRAGLSAQELLRDFYQGLLGRDPDPAGVRSYLARIQRGEYAYVITELVTSDEFEQRMQQAIR